MILVIDDDRAVRSSLTFMLRRAGYEVETVSLPREALEVVRRTAPELILMDMNFSFSTSGEEGLTLLRQVKVFRPESPVILITAWGSIELAVKGMQAGAFNFVTKPWNNAALMQTIGTALELNASVLQHPAGGTNCGTEGEAALPKAFDFIIGRSPAIQEVLRTIACVAPTHAPVLITGESGTGKELIAEALHRAGKRSGESFVKVNLGGLSQSLFESEMFGHKKGAFTGAVSDRAGRFEMADKGTIFLDEIGDLDLSCQVKLLRVLQDHTFEPLGDSRPRQVDVRVVSATNADLPARVRERTFREDLFYRINLITVHLPALRERREDIPLLVRHFSDSLCETAGLPKAEFSAEAMDYLCRLPYPGNIRELKNLVERTLLIAGKPYLEKEDFEHLQKTGAPLPAASSDSLPEGLTLEEVERLSILQALEKYDGNLSRVALSLGISRQSLYRRLEKYNIKTNGG